MPQFVEYGSTIFVSWEDYQKSEQIGVSDILINAMQQTAKFPLGITFISQNITIENILQNFPTLPTWNNIAAIYNFSQAKGEALLEKMKLPLFVIGGKAGINGVENLQTKNLIEIIQHPSFNVTSELFSNWFGVVKGNNDTTENILSVANASNISTRKFQLIPAHAILNSTSYSLLVTPWSNRENYVKKLIMAGLNKMVEEISLKDIITYSAYNIDQTTQSFYDFLTRHLCMTTSEARDIFKDLN